MVSLCEIQEARSVEESAVVRDARTRYSHGLLRDTEVAVARSRSWRAARHTGIRCQMLSERQSSLNLVLRNHASPVDTWRKQFYIINFS